MYSTYPGCIVIQSSRFCLYKTLKSVQCLFACLSTCILIHHFLITSSINLSNIEFQTPNTASIGIHGAINSLTKRFAIHKTIPQSHIVSALTIDGSS